MLDMVHQAVEHAFVSHAPVMSNTVHNAVIKMLSGGASQGYIGPCYQQPDQTDFASAASATVTPPSVPLSYSEGGNGSAFSQQANTTLLPQFNPVYTNSSSFTTSVQGGFAS